MQVAGCRCRLQVAGCRLQVAGCRLQVAGYTLQVAIIIIIIIIIIITINYCRNHGKRKGIYTHTYALMNVRTGYECPSPEDSLT